MATVDGGRCGSGDEGGRHDIEVERVVCSVNRGGVKVVGACSGGRVEGSVQCDDEGVEGVYAEGPRGE